MSAYAAAYAPPVGGHGSYAGGCGTASTSRAPTSYSPPGVASSAAPTASSGGLGGLGGLAGVSGDGSWPTADQLVAAVPVRPFSFSQPAQKVAVGERRNVSELRGLVPKPYAVGEEAEFLLLKGVLTDNEVAGLLASCITALSDLIGAGRGREPELVDGRPRFAIELAERGALGASAPPALRPLIEGSLLPYVRQKYGCPTAALSSVLFRRYVPGERQFVGPHHEHGAFAVARIALQDASSFTGGLFVQGSGRAFLDRKFVTLSRGDVCLHRYDLNHGVEVQEGSRSEIVLYFKDSPQAVSSGSCSWYQQAAERGDAAAQLGLGLSLADQEDFAEANRWLEKACGQDQPEALFTRAECAWEPPANSGLQADTAQALQLFRRAAELGHGRSQSRLGGLLVQGVKGRVQQDSWEGKRLLRLAFEQDDPDAGFYLGQALLQEGDRDGASKLLAACAKGHPRACFQVAEMYREGQYNFPKDVPQSLRYTKWAAHQGDAQALSNLGHIIINGMGVVRDEAKAVRLFRVAAKLGAAEGMLNYGLALLRGNGGVKVDYQEALEWAQKSAALGHSLAHQQLSMFFNAAKNPNPPARSVPSCKEELNRLGVRELRDLLRTEGIDFSDCVEKSDLIARAAMHLPGVAEPWDAAPEHTLLLEPQKRSREDIALLRQRQQQTVSAAAAAAAEVSAAGPNGGSGSAAASSFQEKLPPPSRETSAAASASASQGGSQPVAA
ncbi:unnamed protein product, partial [Polarella glacialis]